MLSPRMAGGGGDGSIDEPWTIIKLSADSE
jgi:hypothetical protein